MRPDIAPGGAFPDFALTDHTTTRRKGSDLQSLDPMIVVPARSNVRPKHYQQHRHLDAFSPQSEADLCTRRA
jgi:hypothetical protein